MVIIIILLFLSTAPTIQSDPFNITVPLNTEVTFSCVVIPAENRNVELIILWVLPDTTTVSSTSEFSDVNNAVFANLTITVTDSSLEGNYICTAQYIDSAPTATSSAGNVEIQRCPDPPEIENGSFIPNGDGFEGDTVTYSCDDGLFELVGSPIATCTEITDTVLEYSPIPVCARKLFITFHACLALAYHCALFMPLLLVRCDKGGWTSIE